MSLLRIAYALLITFFCMHVVLAENPIITQKYTADPNAMVWNGRVYVYCSHDDPNNNSYDMYDYTLVSSDDMVNWTDHGEVFSVRNIPWASLAYAPTCTERDGKFYLYFPNGASSIGVAVADKPEGPFVDPLGKPLLTRSMPNCNVPWLFDPAVFVDDDGQAYLYFGGGSTGAGENLRVIKLNDDMISISGSAVTIHAPQSFEAAFMHKRNDTYYFSYSTNFSTGAAKFDYMMSDDPMTGFVHKGTVIGSPTLNGRNINGGNNNHASFAKFNDVWYAFYHDRRLSGQAFYRNASVDLLTYNSDGTMKTVTVTSDGPPQIKYLDPLDTIQAETINQQSGIETAVCSEGGVMVTDISDGDYIRLKGVDFGDGVSSFEVRASSGSGGGTIELRLGSQNGTRVGTCEISPTGGWDQWETFECDIANCMDVQNLYLVFKGAGEPFRLNWYQFFESSGYSLSVDVQGWGSVTRSSELIRYEEGAEVTLTAAPSDGWVFDGWSGDVQGDQNPLTVTMNERKTITATFLTEFGTQNLVHNGTFSSGADSWTFNRWGGEGSGSVIDDEYRLTVNSVGEEYYEIQVVQPGILLENGKTYRVVFDAYASADRKINVNVGMPEEPYTTFLSSVTNGVSEVDLTTSKQTYRFDFIMEEPTYDNSRIEFSVALQTPTVHIDNVSLFEIEPTTASVSAKKMTSKQMHVRQKESLVNIILNGATAGSISLNVYDLKGSVVHSSRFMTQKRTNQKISFSAKGLPRGYYVVKVRSGSAVFKSGIMLAGH